MGASPGPAEARRPATDGIIRPGRAPRDAADIADIADTANAADASDVDRAVTAFSGVPRPPRILWCSLSKIRHNGSTCTYLADWTATKLRWKLTADTQEREALENLAKDCADTIVKYEAAP
ncbi:hypothetical protein ACFVWY_09670 [Streptomyces sp. NPDC058195]|uniref:hypothetical protein n=1 Tax=Streptomyces sp. NPDC058195 TaxID=3346375 RepID=UPI0036E51B34